MKYVTPEYQMQLTDLAETLSTVTRRRIAESSGAVALAPVIELPVRAEIPDTAA